MGTARSSSDRMEGYGYELCSMFRLRLTHPPGCDKLATIEENLIMAFIPRGTSDESRLAIVLNRANQVCRGVARLIFRVDYYPHRMHAWDCTTRVYETSSTL